jgi:hypothetical protein
MLKNFNFEKKRAVYEILLGKMDETVRPQMTL